MAKSTHACAKSTEYPYSNIFFSVFFLFPFVISLLVMYVSMFTVASVRFSAFQLLGWFSDFDDISFNISFWLHCAVSYLVIHYTPDCSCLFHSLWFTSVFTIHYPFFFILCTTLFSISLVFFLLIQCMLFRFIVLYILQNHHPCALIPHSIAGALCSLAICMVYHTLSLIRYHCHILVLLSVSFLHLLLPSMLLVFLSHTFFFFFFSFPFFLFIDLSSNT
jgi:hypothetical protein